MFDFVINFFTADADPGEDPQQILGPGTTPLASGSSLDSKPSTAAGSSDDPCLSPMKRSAEDASNRRRSLLEISSDIVTTVGGYAEDIASDSAAARFIRHLQEAAADHHAEWTRNVSELWTPTAKPPKKKKQKGKELNRITSIVERNDFLQHQSALALTVHAERVINATRGLAQNVYMGNQCEEQWQNDRLQKYLAWADRQELKRVSVEADVDCGVAGPPLDSPANSVLGPEHIAVTNDKG